MKTRNAGTVPAFLLIFCFLVPLRGAETVEHPFAGVTVIAREETSPRRQRMHVIEIDLTAPGIRFELTPPGGSLETVRRTTQDFLRDEHAQIAINSHFFLPFPSSNPEAMLIGLAVSNGNVYSGFETPEQSYAIVADAPALNIDVTNHAAIVHRDSRFEDGKHVRESVMLWNALAGSAQIVTDGIKTIPVYRDAQHPDGQLTPGGPGAYSNSNSWYDALNARTAIGLTKDNRILVILAVDRARVGDVADILIQDYAVANALNLDGGGSTTLVMEDPVTHASSLLNDSTDNPAGRSVGSNLAIFAGAAGK